MRKQLLEQLKSLNINYKIKEHPPVATVQEAREHWKDVPGTHCKNLFLRDKRGKQHYLVVLEKDQPFSFDTINEILGNEKVSFASERRLMKHLQLTPGSVTPFGVISDTENHVIVLLDEQLKTSELINFHPNINTATVTLSFSDFERFMHQCGNTFKYLDLS